MTLHVENVSTAQSPARARQLHEPRKCKTHPLCKPITRISTWRFACASNSIHGGGLESNRSQVSSACHRGIRIRSIVTIYPSQSGGPALYGGHSERTNETGHEKSRRQSSLDQWSGCSTEAILDPVTADKATFVRSKRLAISNRAARTLRRHSERTNNTGQEVNRPKQSGEVVRTLSPRAYWIHSPQMNAPPFHRQDQRPQPSNGPHILHVETLRIIAKASDAKSQFQTQAVWKSGNSPGKRMGQGRREDRSSRTNHDERNAGN